MTQPAAANPVSRFIRQTGRDTAYVVLGFPSALVAFVVVFALFAVGLSLTVTIIGLPVLATALYAARGFADFERLRLPMVLGRPAPRPMYRRANPGAGFFRRTITPLRDSQSWFDLIQAVFGWILMTVSFCVVITWWAVGLGGTAAVFWYHYIPHGPDNKDLYDLLGQPPVPGGRTGFMTLIGIVFLLLLPLIVRIFALLPAQFARALLTGIAEVQNRITGLREQRDSAVSAEATALRKLERDIHDGPQQRLVRLAMDISRAKAQLAADPEAARTTLDEALGQTRETLDELRALSRGIAPPILADRGLPSALAALASRGVIPVTLDVDDRLGRLSPVVENAAYFLVAEALTNIAKHSRATSCSIVVARRDDRLVVRVTDDGHGGAHVSKGHGLSGLADRLRATAGTLTVTSPAGGPTEIRAELPCV